MDEVKDLRRFVHVVCDDIDGVCDSDTGIRDTITIASFPPEHSDLAVELGFIIARYNGSVRIEFEEY